MFCITNFIEGKVPKRSVEKSPESLYGCIVVVEASEAEFGYQREENQLEQVKAEKDKEVVEKSVYNSDELAHVFVKPQQVENSDPKAHYANDPDCILRCPVVHKVPGIDQSKRSKLYYRSLFPRSIQVSRIGGHDIGEVKGKDDEVPQTNKRVGVYVPLIYRSINDVCQVLQSKRQTQERHVTNDQYIVEKAFDIVSNAIVVLSEIRFKGKELRRVDIRYL